MSKLVWDAAGEHYYESGVSQGVLYPQNSDGTYGAGVAWNGLISVSNNPDGAEPNELWADNIKYAVLRSAETLSLTIEAYTYPKEFEACDGMTSPAGIPGVTFGQQPRQSFGFSYRTEIGSDATTKAGYKLHLVYGCTAQPSDKDYETINDNPDAITFSWEVDSIPANAEGMSPVSEIVIDSRNFVTQAEQDKLDALEEILYGGTNTTAALPSPALVIQTLQ